MVTAISEDYDDELYDLTRKVLNNLGLVEKNGRTWTREDIDSLMPLAQKVYDLAHPTEEDDLPNFNLFQDTAPKEYPFEKLALLGVSNDEQARSLLNREIVDLHVQDGVIQAGLFGKFGKKCNKFWKAHKTAIIIGAIVVVAVVVTIAVISATAGIGGAGAATGGKLLTDLLNSEDEPQESAEAPPQIEQASEPIKSPNVVELAYNENYYLQGEALKIAEQKAKEQRYPGLVYPQDQVDFAKSKANAAYDQFKTDLINNIESKDVKAVLEIAVGAAAFAAAGVATGGAGFVVGAGGLALIGVGAGELASDVVAKVNTFYQPVAQANQDLYKMDQANRQGSLKLCEEVGYKPQLEYSPAQVSSEKTVFVDKNNPNSEMQIIVPVPQ